MTLNAVFDDYEPSPRARALSGAFYSVSDDADAVFYNPAGLAYSNNNLRVSYTRRFSLDFSVLSSVALAYRLPARWGTIGLGLLSHDVDYKDVSLLSEKQYALSHAITLLADVHSEIQLGYTLNLYQLGIESFGDQTSFGLNLGALAILHQRTRLAFAISNLNNPRVGKDSRHDLPQKMSMGISYRPYEEVNTSLELRKGLNEDTEIRAGIEVKVLEILDLRVGVRNKPVSYSAGLGIEVYNITLDYAFNTHATLSGTHHLGLGYKF